MDDFGLWCLEVARDSSKLFGWHSAVFGREHTQAESEEATFR